MNHKPVEKSISDCTYTTVRYLGSEESKDKTLTFPVRTTAR